MYRNPQHWLASPAWRRVVIWSTVKREIALVNYNVLFRAEPLVSQCWRALQARWLGAMETLATKVKEGKNSKKARIACLPLLRRLVLLPYKRHPELMQTMLDRESGAGACLLPTSCLCCVPSSHALCGLTHICTVVLSLPSPVLRALKNSHDEKKVVRLAHFFIRQVAPFCSPDMLRVRELRMSRRHQWQSFTRRLVAWLGLVVGAGGST